MIRFRKDIPLFPDGSVALPGIGFASERTGLFLPAAGALGFSVAGAEVGRWTATGLGSGTTEPHGKLEIFGSAPDLILTRYWGGTNDVRGSAIFHSLDNSVDKLIFGVAGDYPSGAFYTNPNTIAAAKMVIQPDGNIGFNITSFGTSLAKGIAMGAGTAPTTSPADAAQMWVGDQVAGNACFKMRTENGGTLTLYQVVDARIDDVINSGDATTDGVIDAIRDALILHGLMAAA